MADEGLDGSRDKLRRDLATTGIDPPRAESRVLPSEPGRLFVYPRVTWWNRSIRRLCPEEPITISFDRFARGDSTLSDLAGVGRDACRSFVSYRCYLREWPSLLYVLNVIAASDKSDIYAGSEASSGASNTFPRLLFPRSMINLKLIPF